MSKVYQEALIIQSDQDQIVPLENGKIIKEKLGSKNKYLTYLTDGRNVLFEGDNKNIERKKIIAEYIRLFLRGGNKWKTIYKEKI